VTAPAPARTEDVGFVVSLDRFSGPLDLLLHLIRREEIDIWDIPIARIADQFLLAISSLGLDEAAEYLEMAARLVRIKAQMLLPRRGDEEAWEDPRHELVRRLLEYQQIREVVDWMGRAVRRRAERHQRGFLPEGPALPLPPPVFDLAELVQALERVLAMIPDPVMYRIAPRPLDVEGAQRRVVEWLEQRERFILGDFLGDAPTVIDILSALVGILELARRGTCTLNQPAAFAPVMVERGTTHQAA
jgi:segregation and condensation protein A